MPEWPIRNVVNLVLNGQVRIPSFQRGFVWDADRVAFLMDSIYKLYPIGSLLLWQTKNTLKSEKALGPYELQEKNPEYPVYYVLDGQQRITSLFGVFQTELKPIHDDQWTHVFFDYKADPNAQDSQFIALPEQEADPKRYFPLNCLFDSVAYRVASNKLDDSDIAKIDAMQEKFKEIQLPVQIISTENRGAVAMMFERINRAGVPLDTLQLLSAWTWSDDFTLQEQFESLSQELSPFGFEEVGDDANLLLRCCAAILAQKASPNDLISMNGSVVRERFSEIKNGVLGAIDFLRRELKVESLKNLPFASQIVPLAAFFAVPGTAQMKYNDEQRKILVRWFWRSCFSKRFSSGVLRNLNNDIEETIKLRDKKKSTLGEFAVNLEASFFQDNVFKLSSVNTRTLILLLASEEPLSFISGSKVDLGQVLKVYNKAEFHHIFPEAYLKKISIPPKTISCLANFAIITKSDNNQLAGVSPPDYRGKMPRTVDNILNSAFCPLDLFEVEYFKFINVRSEILLKKARELCQLKVD